MNECVYIYIYIYIYMCVCVCVCVFVCVCMYVCNVYQIPFISFTRCMVFLLISCTNTNYFPIQF